MNIKIDYYEFDVDIVPKARDENKRRKLEKKADFLPNGRNFKKNSIFLPAILF